MGSAEGIAGRVLLVRPDGNEADAAALRERGLTPWIDPYLVVRPARDPSGARELLSALADERPTDQVTWLIVTSPRAFPGWAQLVGERELGIAVAARCASSRTGDGSTASKGAYGLPGQSSPGLAWAGGGLRAAAVGRASAATLPGPLAQSALLATRASAAGLLAALAGEPPGRAIIPASEIARPELAAGLRERGWEVIVRSVYETARVEQPPVSASAVSAGHVAAVVLRSPSAVGALAAFTTPASNVRLVAAGGTTAAAVRARGWAVAAAEGPSPEAVAVAVLVALERGG